MLIEFYFCLISQRLFENIKNFGAQTFVLTIEIESTLVIYINFPNSLLFLSKNIIKLLFFLYFEKNKKISQIMTNKIPLSNEINWFEPSSIGSFGSGYVFNAILLRNLVKQLAFLMQVVLKSLSIYIA